MQGNIKIKCYKLLIRNLRTKKYKDLVIIKKKEN